MKNIVLDISKTLGFVHDYEIEEYGGKVEEIHHILHSQNNLGRDFLSWSRTDNLTDKEVLAQVEDIARKIRKDNDAFILIGVGGSLNGARSIIELLKPYFYNDTLGKGEVEIYFAGDSFSTDYLDSLAKNLEGKDFAINLASLSGTTLEPSRAFDFFTSILKKKYGTKHKEHIVITTVPGSPIADTYQTLLAPADIPGRFSALSAVGLLPVAVAGGNIKKIIEGAVDGAEEVGHSGIFDNPSYLYAVVRNILYKHNFEIEILSAYEPKTRYFLKWWQQLFAESEGKNGQGIFPVPAEYSSDLHSLGQIIQQGKRNIFETTLVIGDANELNSKANQAVGEAHFEGGVPCISLHLPEINEYYIGKLYYILEKACAMSAYLSGVHPFDQPGVENYKKKLRDLIKE